MKKRDSPLGTALFCCAAVLLSGPCPASAAPSWLDPLDISKPGRDATNPGRRVDAAGNTVDDLGAAEHPRPEPQHPVLEHGLRVAPSRPHRHLLSVDGSGHRDDSGWHGGRRLEAFENPPGVNVIQAAIRPSGRLLSLPSRLGAPSASSRRNSRSSSTPRGTIVSWTNVDPNSGLDKVECRKMGRRQKIRPARTRSSSRPRWAPRRRILDPLKISPAREEAPPEEGQGRKSPIQNRNPTDRHRGTGRDRRRRQRDRRLDLFRRRQHGGAVCLSARPVGRSPTRRRSPARARTPGKPGSEWTPRATRRRPGSQRRANRRIQAATRPAGGASAPRQYL